MLLNVIIYIFAAGCGFNAVRIAIAATELLDRLFAWVSSAEAILTKFTPHFPP